jgi:arylsulfatase A-like enzyme
MQVAGVRGKTRATTALSSMREKLGHLLRSVRDGLAWPPILGALYLSALTLTALVLSFGDDRIHGVHVANVQRLISSRFRHSIEDSVLLVLALALVFGLALGATAGVVLHIRDRLARVERTALARARSVLSLTAGTHLAVLAYDVALRPALYEDWLYAHGGLRAAFERTASHLLGTHGVLAIALTAAAAWFFWPWVARRAPLPRFPARSLKVPAIAGAGLLLGLIVLASYPKKSHAASPRPNVLVIAVDSLRADRLNARTAPNLAALAARGTRFERAYTPLPRTFPAWVSILTGRYPHHHGIRNMFPRWETRARDFDAIPRHFANAGYRTAVVSDFAGDIFRRIDLGFSRIVAPTFNLNEMLRVRQIEEALPLLPFLRGSLARTLVPTLRELHNAPDAAALSDDALREIDRAKGPFFLTVFYSSAHFPYAAPAPNFERFTDRAYRGPFLYSKADLLEHEAPPSPQDVAQIRALYDGAVFDADAAVGRLLAGLSERGLMENTIIVVTSDHGECLFEAGRGQGHGDHLFGPESVTVPLAIVAQHVKPSRVRQVVRSIDIAPTLCELAGVRCPSDADGRSLAPLLAGKSLPPAPAFAETGLWFTQTIAEVPNGLRLPYPDLTHVTEVLPEHDDEIVLRKSFEPITVTAKHRMLVTERYKLLYMPTRDGVLFRLYDVERDPHETHDVSAEQPALLGELQAQLWRLMLEDRNMEQRNGFLLPRTGRLASAAAATAGVRVDDTD